MKGGFQGKISHETYCSKGVTVFIDSKSDIEILIVNIDNKGKYITTECNTQELKFTRARGKRLTLIEP